MTCETDLHAPIILEAVNIVVEAAGSVAATGEEDPLKSINEEIEEFKNVFDDSGIKLTAGPSHEQCTMSRRTDTNRQPCRCLDGWMDG